jgi:cytochrome oxidase Cu insertion factor (SCO1/SenC/PrrC family)
MKKTFLVALLATTLFACSTPAETKVEATTGTTSVTTEGPDVELMKKAAESWASANWDAYLSCYADTAISVHNVWAVTTDTTVTRKVSSYIDTFKKSREGMDGNVTIDHSIYEVVTMADGSKYGHAWLDCSWKTKDGGTSKTLIFNSYSIKDGKFITEWPIYNTKEFDKLLK